MDDKPHIGLVNAHAECIGADHDTSLAGFPVRLALHPQLVPQSRIVERCRDACRCQCRCDFLCLFPAPDIDDTGSGHPVADVQHLARLVLAFSDNVGKILALEPAFQQRLLLEPELLHDVVGHLRRRGRCQCYHRRIDCLSQFAYFQVVRPEIVPPL